MINKVFHSFKRGSVKIQFFTRNLCLGALITLVLAFSVHGVQEEHPVEIQVPQTISGYPGGMETLTLIAPENAFIRVGSPEDTFPLENASIPTQWDTIYRSTLTLPRQTGIYALSVFIEETRYAVRVSATTTPVQTGALTVRVDPFSGAPGTTAMVTVEATDADNQPADVTVILTASGGTLSTSSVTTGTRGTGTLTLTRGATPGNENYVVASASNYDLVSDRFLISEPPPEPPAPTIAGKPAELNIHDGNHQNGALNSPLDEPFVVEVEDANGDPVADVRVRFRVTQGSGRFSSRTPHTDNNGFAETTFTPTALGRIRVVATVAGLNEIVTFTVRSGALADTASATISTLIAPKVFVAAADRSSILWVDGGAIYALAHASPQRFAPSVENARNLVVGAGKLYWTEKTGESSGTINSVGLNGTGVTELASIRAVPMGIAVDEVNSKLYWTNTRGRIQSANLDGSGIQNVIPDGLEGVTDIAVSEGHAYWIEDGNVHFVNLTGQKQIRNISTGLDTANSLVIAGGKLYWTEMTESGGGTINAANLDGTGATQLASILATPMGIAVDRYRNKLYWTNSRGRIQRANLDGSGIQNVVEGLGSPGEIVLGNSIAPPPETTPTTTVFYAPYDVNKDGTVDNTDARLVIEALGTSDTTYDVDGNGRVDFLDVVLVFDNRDAGVAGAPTVLGNLKLSAVQIDVLQEQIDLLIATGDRSPAAMRTLTYLQQLIATARPEKTQLLANYPNPFNPETWIPYELATDTDVRITIYNTQGVVIRTLALGHQSAGYYTGRDRAAYWDGRNAFGEQVASGVYFYQFETDEMSSMRKMVILK